MLKAEVMEKNALVNSTQVQFARASGLPAVQSAEAASSAVAAAAKEEAGTATAPLICQSNRGNN